MKYQILTDGKRFKVQVRCGIWPLRYWRDLVDEPVPESFETLYFDSYYQAEEEARRRNLIQAWLPVCKPV